jgi:hypothetical protein
MKQAPIEGDKMILEILLSIVITLGAGPTGNFDECPLADQPVAVQQG